MESPNQVLLSWCGTHTVNFARQHPSIFQIINSTRPLEDEFSRSLDGTKVDVFRRLGRREFFNVLHLRTRECHAEKAFLSCICVLPFLFCFTCALETFQVFIPLNERLSTSLIGCTHCPTIIEPRRSENHREATLPELYTKSRCFISQL